MTQKMLFNQAPGPIFTMGPDESLLIHRIGEKDNDALWSLHLWVSTNFSNASEPVAPIVLGGEIGGPVAFPIAALAIADQFSFAGAHLLATSYKIADGIPLRGPMDIHAGVTGGAPAPANFLTQVGFYGYIVRGEGSSREERRFLDASAVGDQVTNFSGGEAITLPALSGGGLPVAVHETNPDYIDEMTVDVYETDEEGGGIITAQFGSFDPATAPLFATSFGAPGSARVQRLLDGAVARDAGELFLSNWSDDLLVRLANGSFVRG